MSYLSSLDQIILSGDSAGGSLALALLSHSLHPRPSIEPLKLSTPLLGAALISPWGDFRTSTDSYIKNGDIDSVDASVLKKWSAYFMGSATPDEYNQPFRTSDSWWNDLPKIVPNVLITAGADEVLVDGIRLFAETIKVSAARRLLFISRKRKHY